MLFRPVRVANFACVSDTEGGWSTLRRSNHVRRNQNGNRYRSFSLAIRGKSMRGRRVEPCSSVGASLRPTITSALGVEVRTNGVLDVGGSATMDIKYARVLIRSGHGLDDS